jgi:hypothetical protein
MDMMSNIDLNFIYCLLIFMSSFIIKFGDIIAQGCINLFVNEIRVTEYF